MTTKDFKGIFHRFLRSKGFAKKSTAYHLLYPEVDIILGLQKSSYSDAYYINVGYIFTTLSSNTDKCKYWDGHIRTRFYFTQNERETDLFTPDLLEENFLVETLESNFTAYIESVKSVEASKILLKKYPDMLLQTTIVAKNFLGFK
ncbi:DUF4304 domain-containing protein [Ohtaekwangia kribbensis]|uniref:DUF4304 domain-containing protein n=1 Tax=Ohtaekwangia kribbensis TaxID=688913 RepID=A0ABW3K0F9_9BACT